MVWKVEEAILLLVHPGVEVLPLSLAKKINLLEVKLCQIILITYRKIICIEMSIFKYNSLH